MTAILGVKADNGVWLTADRFVGSRIKNELAGPKIRAVGLFWVAYSGALCRDFGSDEKIEGDSITHLGEWLGKPCKNYNASAVATDGEHLWIGAIETEGTHWGWQEVKEYCAIGTGDEALLSGYLAALQILREANPNDPGVLPLALRCAMTATAQVVTGVGGPCDQLHVRFERTPRGFARMRLAEFWTDGKPVDIS